MKRTLTALATSVALLSVAVPSFAMDAEHSMLTGKVYHALQSLGLPTDGIADLSLAQIGGISLAINGGGSESEKKQQVQSILQK